MFNSEYWENELKLVCKLVDDNLAIINESNRAFVASNILNSLRNLVESIDSYIYTFEQNQDSINRYDIIQKSICYIKGMGKYKFLDTFHDCLQISLSHYNLLGEYAERIILKYINFLAQVKDTLKKDFNLNVLENLKKLPVDLDSSLEDYYRHIKEVLGNNYGHAPKSGTNTYYIQKKKTIFIDETLFYEYTLTNAFDNVSKFDRFIAFSKIDMYENYAVRCSFESKNINLFGKNISIALISNYWIAIRPCELEKFSKFFGLNQKHSRTEQYDRLMNYIKDNHLPISKIIEFSKIDYENFISLIADNKNQNTGLITLLNTARNFLIKKLTGYNTVKYLSAVFTNSIIKNQLNYEKNINVSNLFLKNGVLVFERTPFSGSLIQHNPSFDVLIDLFDYSEYEDDIFANHIINESNNTASIYISIEESNKEEADRLIKKYNGRIPSFQTQRNLERFSNYVYVKENEINSLHIINLILSKTKLTNFPNYGQYINSVLNNGVIQFDDELKKTTVQTMFLKSSLFCIYGAAGTGKSTLISKELKALGQISKLCLTNTHPALQNMMRKIDDSLVDFKTVKSFISSNNAKTKYDVVVIDECSNISSKDMLDVLNKVEAKLYILAGDIYQLPSIQFGNWFALLRKFIEPAFYVDLFHVYRCREDNVLVNLWDKVRKIDSTIQDTLSAYKISHVIDDSIFEKTNEDEIILTLNYDGLYGINNLNKLLQISNPNEEINWKQYTFKVGDPIIFNETDRFSGYLFNNLKGTIKNITIQENQNIEFVLEIDTILNPFLDYSGFSFISNIDGGKTLINLPVQNSKESDYDNDTNECSKIPFEIAYAVSIHKAQGLEYDSVKLIITKEAEERISHNVFYTAITRAKESLKIFWSPESENYIVKSFEMKNVNKDAQILANKYKLSLIKS
ncbi:MAG: ATP-dependent RecD-like DNA helicase [Candidatus Izemoplasmatales bacterium]|jgi:hypothetical protein|nr:ATP-dependent RecD-like DNA helicase [Candidatus Izemoplasmatales bacterium]